MMIGHYRFLPSPEALARFLLPETLIFVGLLAATLVLISIVVRLRATYDFDLSITLYLQRLDAPWMTAIARWATFMGNALTLVIIAVGMFLFSVFLDQAEAGGFILTSLLALPVNAGLKATFNRARPGEKEVRVYGGPRWGFSYPSGHSMGSASLYGVLSTMLWLYVAQPWLKSTLVGVVLLIPLLCGLSRIYLGAHWFSDVVGGWTGGAVIAFVVTALYGPIAL